MSQDLEAAKEMQGEKLDDEMREMVKMEIEELSARQKELDELIRVLMLPKDPNDDKTSSWKFAEQRVEMKRHCLQRIYTACTHVMPTIKAGAWN